MDFSKFTFRCSSLGYIMQDAKGKSNLEKYEEAHQKYTIKIDELGRTSEKAVKTAERLYDECEKLKAEIERLKPIKDLPHLSDTTKTHLADVYTVVKYRRTSEIKSKYLEKGLLLEEDAITMYSLLVGQYFKKNKERKTNEWIEGELDIVDEEFVHDTKVNWDIFTFNRTVTRKIKSLYAWQLDGYMWLWNKKKGKLVYCLLNTPEHLIVREEKKLLYELFGDQSNFNSAPDNFKNDYYEACKEIRRNHIYDDMPITEKVKVRDVFFSEERIEKIKKRVEDCRTYLNWMEAGIIDNENYENENQ